MPTETVYGLAANAFDPAAVKKIFEAKGRPQDNPLIVHIADMDALTSIVSSVPENALKLAERFWPGPLTIIMPRSPRVPPIVSCGLDTVAVRMPSHPIAAALIRASGVPLAAPSANLSGSPSPTCARHVIQDLDGRIDAVADAGDCEVGVESTVVTLTTPVPRLLRPGGITHEQLTEVLGECEIDSAVLGRLKEGQKAASPGMKYKHYSPKASVTVVRGSLDAFVRYVQQNAQNSDIAMCFENEQDKIPLSCLSMGGEHEFSVQAHRLFSELRRADELGAGAVFVRCPDTSGVGLAVYNRLLRASGFHVAEAEKYFKS